MSGRSSDEGITLVEIIMSLFILGLVLTTFFTVITGSLRSQSESRARQAASQVATQLIEGLREFAPSQIALESSFDLSGFTCDATIDPSFDPDGPGPLGCEPVVSGTGGKITAGEPYQGPAATSTVDGMTVTTVATEVDDPNVPSGTVRVTVVLDYQLPGASETIRRSAFFSEVSRG